MADSAISDLTQAPLIQQQDLFVLEQNGEAKKLLGSQLTDFVNREIEHITVETVGPDMPATVKSYDRDTHTIVLQLPRGAAIASVRNPVITDILYKTYKLITESVYGEGAIEIPFTVKDGDYITDIEAVVETHTPGGFDTYEFQFAERDPIQIDVYNGANGGGAAEYDDDEEGIYIVDGGSTISANAVSYDPDETYEDGTVGKALQNIDFPKITNSQIDALFA